MPLILFSFFCTWLQRPSIVLVWVPVVGCTKFWEWFTITQVDVTNVVLVEIRCKYVQDRFVCNAETIWTKSSMIPKSVLTVADRLQTENRKVTNSWLTVTLVTDCHPTLFCLKWEYSQPTVGCLLADYWSSVSRLLVFYWPNVSQQWAERFLGSWLSLLPNYLAAKISLDLSTT